jgi:hypothetical protein
MAEHKVALTRRMLLKFAAAGLGAGVAARAPAQAKIAPNLVQYQTTPKNGLQCANCLQFVAPDSCKVVDGKISPTGWCAAFAAKAK